MNNPKLAAMPTLQADEAFIEKLLERHAQQPRRVMLPVILTTLAIGGIAATAVPLAWVLVWLSVIASVLAGRWFVVGRLNISNGRSATKRLHIAVAMMALSGVAHALSLAFFPFLPQFERALQSMLLVGLSAGCVATAAGYPPLFRAYAIATLGPLAVVWAVSPGPAEVAWVQGLMSVIMVLFGLAFDVLARDTFKLFKESYDYRLGLMAALDRAEKASRAKTRFLASASHDLRQPMQTLALFAATLAMRPLDERSRELTRDMNDALLDLTGELDALLDISKLDAGVVQAQLAVFQLESILNRILSIYAPLAEQKQLRLSVDCPREICVDIDRKLFDRMLRNLVENAIKYTDPGGWVRINAAARGTTCVVSIADTGRGIPATEQERVFEEFYQLDNPGRDRSKGLGLGLAIVRRLADLMSIELTLQSEPGVGSTFDLTVPLGEANSPSHSRSLFKLASAAGLQVLFVDDEESVRLGMQGMLEGVGCRTLLAPGTTEAMHLARQFKPDVLIADFRLRGTDSGLKTIAEIRSLYPCMPVLLLSGDTAPDRLREAQEAGITMLHKPVSAQALLQEILRITHNNKQGTDHGDTQEGPACRGPMDLTRV